MDQQYGGGYIVLGNTLIHAYIGKRPHGYRRNPLPIEAQGHADTRVGSYVYSCDLIDFTELDQGVKQTDPGILRQILYWDILGLYQAFIQ